jgi:hypothetical protein
VTEDGTAMKPDQAKLDYTCVAWTTMLLPVSSIFKEWLAWVFASARSTDLPSYELNQGSVIFHKEELLFSRSNAEIVVSGIERDKEQLLREVFVNC